MNIFTVVKNDFVADLAFVVKNDLFATKESPSNELPEEKYFIFIFSISLSTLSYVSI